jgi:hypothetical protein
VEPWSLEKQQIDTEPLTYIITRNLLRQHLTVANRRLFAERIAVARSEGQKKDEQAPTIKAAAVKLGVGERTVHDVRKLKGHAPEEHEKLNSQEHKSVNAAVKAAGITKSRIGPSRVTLVSEV